MIKATSGSLFQPRSGAPRLQRLRAAARLGVQHRLQDRGPRRIWHQLHVLQPAGKRPGGDQCSAGPVRRPQPVESSGGPPAFLTTLNSFTTNIASPAAFNPANSNVVYTPPDSKWPYIQNWFFSVQRQLPKNTVLELAYNGNHSLRLPIIADYNQAAPNQPGQSLGVHGARADTDFRARSPGSIRRATITTMASRPAWSTASPRACTS